MVRLHRAGVFFFFPLKFGFYGNTGIEEEFKGQRYFSLRDKISSSPYAKRNLNTCGAVIRIPMQVFWKFFREYCP